MNQEIKCEICGKKFDLHIGSHVHFAHKMSKQEYFDRFFKKDGDGICMQCGKPTTFFKGENRYLKFCSIKCARVNDDVQSKWRKTCMGKYGVENPSQSKMIKDKKAQTCMSNFGVKWPMQSREVMDKSRNTLIEKYGASHIMKSEEGRELHRKVINDKYGCDNGFQSEIIKAKIRSTNIRKYGVPFPSQNKEIFKKQQISMKKFKEYVLPSGKVIEIKGYEPQFLDYVLNNKLLTESEIQYEAFSIKYQLNDKEKVYYPDFYIPKYNLIVEIKSSYVLNELDLVGEQSAKTEACLQLGYKFALIVDNDFTEITEKLLDTSQVSLA